MAKAIMLRGIFASNCSRIVFFDGTVDDFIKRWTELDPVIQQNYVKLYQQLELTL